MALTITSTALSSVQNSNKSQNSASSIQNGVGGQLKIENTRSQEAGESAAGNGTLSIKSAATESAAVIGVSAQSAGSAATVRLADAAVQSTLREAEIEEVAAGIQEVLGQAEALANQFDGDDGEEKRLEIAERLEGLRSEIDAVAKDNDEPVVVPKIETEAPAPQEDSSDEDESLQLDSEQAEQQSITVERFPSSDELGITEELTRPEAFSAENREQTIQTLRTATERADSSLQGFKANGAELSNEVQARRTDASLSANGNEPEEAAARVASSAPEALTSAVREDFNIPPQKLSSLIEIEATVEEAVAPRATEPREAAETREPAARAEKAEGPAGPVKNDNASTAQQLTR